MKSALILPVFLNIFFVQSNSCSYAKCPWQTKKYFLIDVHYNCLYQKRVLRLVNSLSILQKCKSTMITILQCFERIVTGSTVVWTESENHLFNLYYCNQMGSVTTWGSWFRHFDLSSYLRLSRFQMLLFFPDNVSFYFKESNICNRSSGSLQALNSWPAKFWFTCLSQWRALQFFIWVNGLGVPSRLWHLPIYHGEVRTFQT